MIKYPNKKNDIKLINNSNLKFFPVIECNSITDYINANVVTVGTKFKINNWNITCIDINDNDYYFQYDDCISEVNSWNELSEALEKIWHDTNIIPEELRKEIGYIFIPTEKQITGINKYGDKEKDTYQFEYYKNNEAHRVKNYNGKTDWYWLASPCSGNSTYALFVDNDGVVDSYSVTGTVGRVPVCFKIKKES